MESVFVNSQSLDIYRRWKIILEIAGKVCWIKKYPYLCCRIIDLVQTRNQASIPKWMSVFFQKTYYNSSRGEVLYQGGPKFLRLNAKTRLFCLFLGKDCSEPKDEERDIPYSPELKSKSLHFCIEGLCRSVGSPVVEVVQDGVIVVHERLQDCVEALHLHLSHALIPSG